MFGTGKCRYGLVQERAKASDHQKTKVGLAMAGVLLLLLFLVKHGLGKSLTPGYFLSSNPANTFLFNHSLACFPCLAGLLLGLWLPLKFSRGCSASTESVGLLGAYWHYMLLVWGVSFAMLITTKE